MAGPVFLELLQNKQGIGAQLNFVGRKKKASDRECDISAQLPKTALLPNQD